MIFITKRNENSFLSNNLYIIDIILYYININRLSKIDEKIIGVIKKYAFRCSFIVTLSENIIEFCHILNATDAVRHISAVEIGTKAECLFTADRK
jgi:hypothetical protein